MSMTVTLEQARNVLDALDVKDAKKVDAKQAQKKLTAVFSNEDRVEKVTEELDGLDKSVRKVVKKMLDEEDEIIVEDEEDEADDEEETDESDEEESDEEEDEEEEDDDEKPRKKKGEKASKNGKPKKKSAGKVERDAFGASTNSGGHTVNRVLFELDGESMTKEEIDEEAEKVGKKTGTKPRTTGSYLRWLVERELLAKGKNDDGKVTYRLTKLGAKVAAGKASEPERVTKEPAKKTGKKKVKK
jgi:hypothetical protein